MQTLNFKSVNGLIIKILKWFIFEQMFMFL